MKVVLLCEGSTERALAPGLRLLTHRLIAGGDRIGLESHPLNGPVLRQKLRKLVDLHGSRKDVVGVIALTDVYPDFKDAEDAKKHLVNLVANCEHVKKFRAHAAQFDVEAWLIPSWTEIAKSLNVQRQPPAAQPEQINRDKPPSFYFAELYSSAKRKFSKPIAARRWFTPECLERAAEHCPQLRSLLDSILEFAGDQTLNR